MMDIWRFAKIDGKIKINICIMLDKRYVRGGFMSEEKDIIRNSLIALTAAVPYAGGTISFLLDKYIPSEAERKRNEFIKRLEQDIKEIKEKIDIANLETPEFYSIFTKLLKASMEEYREEKLHAFRNLTLNIALEPQKFNKIDFFTRLVLSLVPDEIMLLRVFYLLDVKGELKMYDDNPKKRNIFNIVSKLYGIEDNLYIHAMLTNCTRYRLILSNGELNVQFGRDGYYLSDLGKDFLSYIFLPKEDGFYGFKER